MASVLSPRPRRPRRPRRPQPRHSRQRLPLLVPQQRQARTQRLDRTQETFRSRARAASKLGGLALALAAPLLVLAVLAYRAGFSSAELDWISARGSVAVRGPGFSGLQYVYPPVPVLLSLIFPDDRLSLAVITCLFSGLMAALLLRRIGLVPAVILGLPLILVPEMWYTASELLPQVVALTLLAIALQGFIEFAAYGETYGGFIAGLALAGSYAADPGALIYAGVMCLFVPVLGPARYRGHPTAPLGVCAVLVFPCAALALSWSFLIWKFTGHWPGNLAYAPGADVLKFPLGVLGGLRHALAAAFLDASRSVLYLVALVLLCARRRTLVVGLGLVLPVLGLALALWLGFDYSSVTAYYLLVLLAITVISEFRLLRNPLFTWILVVAAVAQVAVAFVWLSPTAGYTAWEQLLFHGHLTLAGH